MRERQYDELDVEYLKDRIHSLEAQVKEADKIIACCELRMEALEAKAEQAEKRVKELAVLNVNLSGQLEEAERKRQCAEHHTKEQENANDELATQNARLKKALEEIVEMCDDETGCVIEADCKKLAKSCLQQLSNQGDGK